MSDDVRVLLLDLLRAYDADLDSEIKSKPSSDLRHAFLQEPYRAQRALVAKALGEVGK